MKNKVVVIICFITHGILAADRRTPTSNLDDKNEIGEDRLEKVRDYD